MEENIEVSEVKELNGADTKTSYQSPYPWESIQSSIDLVKQIVTGKIENSLIMPSFGP